MFGSFSLQYIRQAARRFVAADSGNVAVIFTIAAIPIISFVGAGIYEEMLFRLFLFSGLAWLFRVWEVPSPGLLAGAISSVLFAAAHNIGPHGESFIPYVFLFRTLAGFYFTLLYRFRGFGIGVGAHAGYDVLVGVLMKT